MVIKKGHILLNGNNYYAWDDNTEFYDDFNVAAERAVELQQNAEPGTTIKVIPATLSYEV